MELQLTSGFLFTEAPNDFNEMLYSPRSLLPPEGLPNLEVRRQTLCLLRGGGRIATSLQQIRHAKQLFL